MARIETVDQSARARAPRASERTVLVGFALGHCANDWVAGTIWLLAPAIAASMGLGATEVGLLIALTGVGAALAYLPAGILADRTRERGPLLAATFWWVAIGYLAASFAQGFGLLAVLFAVAVMGDAAWHPVATGYLVQRMPDRRARVLGYHAMGGTIGAEVAAPLGIGLLLSVVDWRTALQVSVVPALLMGIVFARYARRLGPSPAAARDGPSLRAMLGAWGSRGGPTLIAYMLLYNMAIVSILAMMPLYLQTVRGFTAFEAGVVFAVTLLLGSFGQPVAGHVSDRAGRPPLLVGGAAAGAALALGAASATATWSVVACLVLSVALLAAVRSVVLAATVEHASGRESTTLALGFTLMDGIGAVGALLAGIVGEADLTHAFALAAGLATAAAVLGAFLRPGNR